MLCTALLAGSIRSTSSSNATSYNCTLWNGAYLRCFICLLSIQGCLPCLRYSKRTSHQTPTNLEPLKMFVWRSSIVWRPRGYAWGCATLHWFWSCQIEASCCNKYMRRRPHNIGCWQSTRNTVSNTLTFGSCTACASQNLCCETQSSSWVQQPSLALKTQRARS